jgi:quercetin dioxygenase-like cupin family protein
MSFEQYKIPQGNILIAFSDKNLSVGTMTLNAKQELSKHNRPVLESLFQIQGKCVIKLFQEDQIKEITLNPGDSLDIPSESYHIHSNPFDQVSVSLWKASGDITEILNQIRKNSEM